MTTTFGLILPIQVKDRDLAGLWEELVEEVRLRASVSRPVFRDSAPRAGAIPEASGTGDDFQLGQRVEHPKFGEGVVLMYEGQGSHARVQVNFENAGAKWLVVAYANLQTV